MEFLSPEVALYLFKSTIRPCMENCRHAGLVLLVATWNCKMSYKNEYAGLLVLTLLPVLNSWFIVKCSQLECLSFFCSYSLADIDLNWLNSFHLLILEGELLIILVDYMIFLSPFLDVTRMRISTVSFLAQLDSGIIWL